MAFEQLFSFSGRLGRAEYWLWQLGWFVVIAFSFLLVYVPFGSIVFLITLCAYLVAGLSIEVRRWHDLDKSGLWYFIALIPFVGWLIKLVLLGFTAGSPYPNSYGLPYGTRPEHFGMRSQAPYQVASGARPTWMLQAASAPGTVLGSCPSCAKENPMGERFCAGCGAKLTVPALHQPA